MDAIWSMPLSKVFPGDKLQILVENQGRIGFGGGNVDFKGKTNPCYDRKIYLPIHFSVNRGDEYTNDKFMVILRPCWQRYFVWPCVTRMGNDWNAYE